MNKDFTKTKEALTRNVVEDIDFTKNISDDELKRRIDDFMGSINNKSKFSIDDRLFIREEVFNSLRRMDVIQEFLDNDSITEIMINGKDQIFVEENGIVRKTDKSFSSEKKLEDVIQQIVGSCNRTVNEASPIQDARLSGGERVNVVLPPISLCGPVVTIRRFPKNPITMERLIELGSLTREAADFLESLVKGKYNIFISGGTGSGKTTFLNALSQFIPKDERVITIEDSAELQLQGIENLVKLEARRRNSEGVNEISIRDLIKAELKKYVLCD